MLPAAVYWPDHLRARLKLWRTLWHRYAWGERADRSGVDVLAVVEEHHVRDGSPAAGQVTAGRRVS